MSAPQIVWLRRDLRLADQPALHAAALAGPVIPVFVLDDDRAGDHAYGGASRVWLHHSLDSLSRSLASRHCRIVLRRGDAPQILAAIAAQTLSVSAPLPSLYCCLLTAAWPWRRRALPSVLPREAGAGAACLLKSSLNSSSER